MILSVSRWPQKRFFCESLRAAILCTAMTVSGAWGVELVMQFVPAQPAAIETPFAADQLPHSRVARGRNDIVRVWFAGPTDRYAHGVLGDRLEASRLVVDTRDGKRLLLELPAHRVFEDLEPRLSDLDGDGRDEILVVESDIRLGASVAVYGLDRGRIAKRSATPFMGLANRWINPLGVGDFDGDGKPDIALVETPHIGGILRLYRFDGAQLLPFAELQGVSTHRLGRTELGLGTVVPSRPRDRILVPDQAHRILNLVEWSAQGWVWLARLDLPAPLGMSLRATGNGRWQAGLEDGRTIVIILK